ncbi:hypothetical protein POX_e06284 [Penicillium oxalicum]|nr:hypothetical protein POX_e06284 [Penicillium oxalicum]KAI2788271.1 hypothetical protein POX_e06284 [Penicillium oxalicum]
MDIHSGSSMTIIDCRVWLPFPISPCSEATIDVTDKSMLP